jgi:hypothetical protein
MVVTRTSSIPRSAVPGLAVVPQPHWRHEFGDIPARFWTGLDRNEHVIIELGPDEARIPEERVEPGILPADR